MNREEILSKSRVDNKGKDLFEKEVLISAGNAASVAAVILATLFFVIQTVVGLGFNYGFYAIILCVLAVGYIVKAFQMRRRKDVIAAIITSIATIIFSVACIHGLISSSPIL